MGIKHILSDHPRKKLFIFNKRLVQLDLLNVLDVVYTSLLRILHLYKSPFTMVYTLQFKNMQF